MSKRKILVYCSDLHVNSTVGLCPPNVIQDDGQSHILSPLQVKLWKGWEMAWQWVKYEAGTDEIVTIFGGDLGEADSKNRSTQVITRNKSTMLTMISDALEPAYKISRRAFFIRGTEAHVGKSAWVEEETAKDCLIAVPASKKIYSHWQLRLNIDGYRIFASHHPPSMTNPVNAAKKIRDMYYTFGEQPPDLALFGHIHTVYDSGLTIKPRIMTAPCWTYGGAYIKRLGIYDAPQIGLIALEIVDGKLIGEPMVYRLPVEKESEIKL